MKFILKSQIFRAISIILTISLLWQNIIYAYPDTKDCLRVPIGVKSHNRMVESFNQITDEISKPARIEPAIVKSDVSKDDFKSVNNFTLKVLFNPLVRGFLSALGKVMFSIPKPLRRLMVFVPVFGIVFTVFSNSVYAFSINAEVVNETVNGLTFKFRPWQEASDRANETLGGIGKVLGEAHGLSGKELKHFIYSEFIPDMKPILAKQGISDVNVIPVGHEIKVPEKYLEGLSSDKLEEVLASLRDRGWAPLDYTSSESTITETVDTDKVSDVDNADIGSGADSGGMETGVSDGDAVMDAASTETPTETTTSTPASTEMPTPTATPASAGNSSDTNAFLDDSNFFTDALGWIQQNPVLTAGIVIAGAAIVVGSVILYKKYKKNKAGEDKAKLPKQKKADSKTNAVDRKKLREAEKQETELKEQQRVDRVLADMSPVNDKAMLKEYRKDPDSQIRSAAKNKIRIIGVENRQNKKNKDKAEKNEKQRLKEVEKQKENSDKNKKSSFPKIVKGMGLISMMALIVLAVQHHSASESDTTFYSDKLNNYGTPPAIVLNIDEINDGNNDGIYDNIVLSHGAGSAAVQVQQNEKLPYYHGQTFLIIGRDGGNDGVSSEDPDGDGGKDGGRADVLILLNVSPDKKISIIPIPRDSKVKIPGHSGYSKINAALNGTNYERQVATVENTLGVEVDGYVLVDFNSAAKVIQIAKDVLGIKNKFDIAKVFINSGGYKGIDFDDVKTLLSLEGALRSRTGKGLDANVRAQNNARFVGFLLKQGVLFYNSDNEKGVKLISEVLAECETDIADEELLKVIKDSDPENLGDISYYEIPGRGGMEDGAWYFRLSTPDNPDETLYEHVTGQKIMRSNL